MRIKPWVFFILKIVPSSQNPGGVFKGSEVFGVENIQGSAQP